MASSRGKRRPEEPEHEEHVNHEAWVIPYADILTLLMALFLVLFAIGRTDEEKLDLAAESFRREFGMGSSPLDLGSGTGGAGPLAAGGASVLDGLGPSPSASDVPPDALPPPATTDAPVVPPEVVIVPGRDDGETSDQVTLEPSTFVPVEPADGQVADPLAAVEQAVREQAVRTGLADAIGFRREARGLVVTIVTDQVLFEEGRAEIQPAGYRLLDVVTDALIDVPNPVIVEGHTDSRPISTPQFPSNWELSTARATSVLRYLVEQHGFPGGRISASGYADTHPIDAGSDGAAMEKNRRVEIVVLAS